MARGLQIAEPPRRKSEPVVEQTAEERQAPQPSPDGQGRGLKFTQVAAHEKVQFNKRVTRGVSDGFEMLAIKTRKRVPELLAEALQLLEERYGKV